MAKNKNPLYVVSKKTGIVEEAFGKIDFLVKKLGLEPVMGILKQVWDLMIAQVSNYSTLVIFKAYLDEMIEKLKKVLTPLLPFMA